MLTPARQLHPVRSTADLRKSARADAQMCAAGRPAAPFIEA